MTAIGNNFRLHNRTKPLTLTNRSITSQNVCRISDGQFAWEALCRIQLQHVAPFCKPGTFLVCLRRSLLQIIKSFARNLWVPKWASLSTPDALLVIGFVQLNA